MKKTRKYLALFLTICLLVLIPACSQDASSTEKQSTASGESVLGETAKNITEAGDKIKIGVSVQGFKGIFVQYIVAGIYDYLDTNSLRDKVEVIVVDAEDKADKQVSQVETLIADGVQAIIINPVDSVGSSPAVDAAVTAGIPVITVNTTTENQSEANAYVGSDDVEAGRIQMEALAKMIDYKGAVAVIHGAMGHSAQIGRWTGYQEVIAKYPDMSIAIDQTADWQTDKAQSLVENWLQAGTDIKAIAANCDTMAIGAQNAIDGAGLLGKIKVGGMDAISDAMKSIKDDELACTIWQDGIAQGANALRLAIDAAEGKTIEDYFIPYELITKDNLAEYEAKAATRDALNMKYNG